MTNYTPLNEFHPKIQKVFKKLTMQVLRRLIRERKTNGFDKVCIKVCGCWYINEDEFFRWVENENK